MAFVPIRSSTLRPGAPLLFDIYVQFKDEFLKFRQANDQLEGDLLERFKTKKVKKVFIPAEQEPLYLQFLDQALDQLQEKSTPLAERSEFAQDTLKQESENIGKSLESEKSYRDSESRIHKVVEFILSEPTALAGMLTSAGLSLDDSAHGSTVSSLCLAVGAHSKFLSRDDLTDVAVAGLLHDTGLKSLGFDAKSDLSNVPVELRAKFRSHPEAAKNLVAGKKFITAKVLRIIEDHEEFGDGLGFPEKKRIGKLLDASQVFNLCDAFDHHCIRQGKPAQDCIESFIEARAEHFELALIEMLEKQVKAK